MSSSDLRKQIGQLFAVGFRGTTPSDNIRSLICDYGIGAIVLFKRNVQDAAQLQRLCRDLQKIARDAGHEQPLFIGIDQENGMVSRIMPPIAPQMPGPMTLGATGSPDAAYEVGKATGEMLRYFGINMNYAPVGDVNNEPLNPVIGVRSPGDDPAQVAEFASACARGLQEASVAPCIKHFPGHGDTAVDSHYGLPVIDKTRDDMDNLELVPFRRAAEESIEMVMTAHISLPKLTGTKLPATLSPEALGILRNEVDYNGVIMTDCMEMDGIRATYGTVEGALIALQAGVDNVMICHTFDVQTAAVDRVCKAVKSGEISRERIEASLERLRKLKARYTTWETVLQDEASGTLADINRRGEKLAERLYADAVTLVRARDGLLPLSKSAKTVFVTPGQNAPVSGIMGEEAPANLPWASTSFGKILETYASNVTAVQFDKSGLSDEQWRTVDDADTVILATRNALESQYQRDTGAALAERCGSKLVAVATCAPYDFLENERVETYVAMYEPTAEAFAAAVGILYGGAASKGRLPVSVKRS